MKYTLFALGVVAFAQAQPSFDVIVRGGTVVDGSGAPRYLADVAIAGGSIARIGDLAGVRAVLVRPISIDGGSRSAIRA